MNDIFLTVGVFGVYSEANYHSFKSLSTPLIFGRTCEICSEFVFPLTFPVQCLRCNLIVHRACCFRSTAAVNKCSLFGIRYKCKSKGTYVSNTADALLYMPPGIIVCWDDILLERTKIMPLQSQEVCISNRVKLERLVISMLRDTASAPGNLLNICRSIFMLIKFNKVTDVVRHAREFLNVITYSAVLTLQISYQEIIVETNYIVNIADKYILEMYNMEIYKIVMAVMKLSKEKDYQLMKARAQKNLRNAFISENKKAASRWIFYYQNLDSRTTAYDKIRYLTEVLRVESSDPCFMNSASPSPFTASGNNQCSYLNENDNSSTDEPRVGISEYLGKFSNDVKNEIVLEVQGQASDGTAEGTDQNRSSVPLQLPVPTLLPAPVSLAGTPDGTDHR